MSVDENYIVGWHVDSEAKGDLHRAIQLDNENHMLTIAPTGSGKGTGVVIPNLLNYSGSVIVIDPKAENYFITKRYRESIGQKVYIFDPFGEAESVARDAAIDIPISDRFNPLDLLRLDEQGLEDNCVMLADIFAPPYGDSNHFWNEKARELMSGLMCYLATASHEEDCSFRRLSEILTNEKFMYSLDEESQRTDHNRWLEEEKKYKVELKRWSEEAKSKNDDSKEEPPVRTRFRSDRKPKLRPEPSNPEKLFTQKILDDESTHPFVKSQISPFANIARLGMLSDIFSIATNYLSEMRSSRLLNTLADSTIDLEAVRKGDDFTIYIVIPPSKLISHSAILKSTIAVLMSTVMSRTKKPRLPTLFMLDECAQLGELEHLRTAVTLLRGYGMRTWMFFQDLAQIEHLYKSDWKTIVGNCGLVQTFGINRIVGNEALTGVLNVDSDSLSDFVRLRRGDQAISVGGKKTTISQLFVSWDDPVFGERADVDPRRNSN